MGRGCAWGNCQSLRDIWTANLQTAVVVGRCIAPNGGGIREHRANKQFIESDFIGKG
jgi:hypothetical protein